MILRELTSNLTEYLGENVYLDVLYSNSNYHPKLNKILGYYLKSLKNDNWIYINLSHSDLPKHDPDNIHQLLLSSFTKIVTLDKKSLMFFLDSDKIFDLRITNKKDYEISTLNTFNIPKKFENSKNVNQLIPIVKHIEQFQFNFESVRNDIDLSKIEFDKFTNDYINVFFKLENNYIFSDESILTKYFPKVNLSNSLKNNQLFTVYNLYNPTLRPTINFNKINLLNLSKSSGVRELIRSKNGYLINYDYKGFHLSLLCKFIKYDLKYANVYVELYNQIHSTDYLELTVEQHDFIKNEFFQIFFSDKLEYNKDSELLDKIFSFKKSLLKYFEKNDYIKSPVTSKIYSHDSFNNKNIFSIFFRIVETEINVKTLSKIHAYLADKKTKIILYQYDSFLFDWHKDDGKEVLKELKNILTYNRTYEISISNGKTFSALKT